MAGHDEPSPIDFPPLREVEQAGADAAVRMARSILEDTLANKGSPDLARLERGGPQVRRIYLQLLAREAAPPVAMSERAQATRPALGSSKASSGRRATVEWSNLRREPENAWVLAILSGLCGATVVGGLGFIAIVIFKF